ncbi:MAG: ABC transporter substrate-binding protein [Lachnospiraceae bacterium]|nr:ABC transporter substrate-binding protein [Lachnospiraceae bacterium]
MKKWRKLAAMGLTAAMVLGTTVFAKAEEDITVHVGDQAAFFLVKTAVEKGFFEEEFADDNITIESEIFAKMGPAIIEGMGAGDVDLSIVGGLPIVNANNNGNEIKVLASGNYSVDGFHLVAGPDTGVTSVDQLKGKSIGVAFGTAEHQIVLELVEKYGIQDEVEIVNLSPADALAAIVKGDITAALFNSGSLLDAENAGCETIATNEEVGLVVNYVIGRKAFVEENPEITSRFLKVLDKTAKWIDENEDETVALAAQVIGDEEDNTRISLEARGRKVSIDDEFLADPFGKTLQFAKDQGLVSEDLAYDSIVDTSYFEQAGIEE